MTPRPDPPASSQVSPAAVVDGLYRRDLCSQALGIEIVDASPDRATARMVVRPDMCNGFGILHGGMTFLLADTAMAFASNADNEVALAASAEIDWLAPVREGETITATAERRWAGGRTTVWDISVTNDTAAVVALFRGRTRTTGRPVIATETEPDQANSEPR
jgi:acyl-CoA thioesterase